MNLFNREHQNIQKRKKTFFKLDYDIVSSYGFLMFFAIKDLAIKYWGFKNK